MQQVRISRDRKRVDPKPWERFDVLPLDPRDPAIVRAKELARAERRA
jgi:hypothetical protein